MRSLRLPLLALFLARAAAYPNVIASQSAAAQSAASWFAGLPTWHVHPSAVPASPAVPAADPARDMVFDATALVFSVFPVNPASSFAVDLVFLDDGGHRAQSLAVGGALVAPRIALADRAILRVNFSIPPSAVAPLPAAGNASALTFSLARLAGPNAILSSFALSSSDPADPPVAPVAPPRPSHALPRLTPRPAAVDGAGAAAAVDLAGAWDFDAAPPPALLAALRGGARAAARAALAARAGAWVPIAVPGEYTLQGHRVAAGAPVVYHRAFAAPAAWAGLRAKLRFDGVYSGAEVFVNGAAAGAHLGGFTPFELDVTALLAPGGAPNNLTVVVTGATLADALASGSQYATHDLGGIARKVVLFAAPPVSVADVHVVTVLGAGAAPGAASAPATLVLNVSLANDGAAAAGAPSVVRAALAFRGAPVAAGEVDFPAVAAGAVVYAQLNLSVADAALWDPEHPRLHDLALSLATPGAPGETLALRVGFRDVAVAGNRVLVNGRAVKARGTTRHETHPLAGRALGALDTAGGGQWARDIEAFRDINVNYIRTSHYPPPEELMAAADEMGMLVELEMPFCWASGNAGAAAFNYTVQVQREAMTHLRNHPSVTLWSLGNESPWNENFQDSLSSYLREVDSTRPFMFDGGQGQAAPPLDVISNHYPSFAAAAAAANATVPTLFGEYAHLNCYNRRELATDEGIRDIWALGIEKMWSIVYHAEGSLGACYWAGIDDIFYMPGGQPVGYGEWGVIDAWRRAKPETFHVRNIYAPVVIAAPAPGGAWAPALAVENRHDFTDLSEVAFSWAIPERALSGAGAASGGPHTAGNALALSGLPADLSSGTLEINATSPRGFLINAWAFPLGAPAAPRRRAAGAAPTVTPLPDGSLLIRDAAGAFSWRVDARGALSGNTSAGGQVLAGGPALMVLPIRGEDSMQLVEGAPPILPWNDALTKWALANRSWSVVGDAAVVVLTGAYAEAAGAFTLSFDGAARVRCAYDFSWTGAAVAPRQIGLVWAAPGDLAAVSWRRTAQWPAKYPADHIGRPAGDGVRANAGPAPGNVTRAGAWADDASPLGSPDFRSTRHNVTVFELGAGARALAFVSAGAQHARAWVADDGGVGLLTADVSNEGGNPFSREGVLPHPRVAAGFALRGEAELQMGSALA